MSIFDDAVKIAKEHGESMAEQHRDYYYHKCYKMKRAWAGLVVLIDNVGRWEHQGQECGGCIEHQAALDNIKALAKQWAEEV